MHRWSIAQGDERSACYALRAEEYARYYRNVPAGEFTDEFDTATTSGGEPVGHVIAVWEDDRLAGTVRLVLARHPRHPELKSEVAELMDFDWGSVAQLIGVDPETLAVGEIGKFAVPRIGDARRTKWVAATSAGSMAVALGLNVVLSVMSPAVERSVRQAGIRFHRLEGASLRRDKSSLNRTLLRYHDYFLPNLQRMGLDVDPEHLDEARSQALRMMMAGSNDGSVMWWISPDEMANAPFPAEWGAGNKS